MSYLIIFLLCLFVSCQEAESVTPQNQSDDDEPSEELLEESVIGEISAIVSYIYSAASTTEERYDFSYDSAQRVSQMTFSERVTPVDSLAESSEYIVTFTYEYLDELLEQSKFSEYIVEGVTTLQTTAQKSLLLNSMGYIDSRSSSSNNSGDTYIEENSFDYDDSGYLMNYNTLYCREVDGAVEYGALSGRKEYTYKGGNLTYISFHDLDEVGYLEREVTYSQYPNTLNLNLDYLLGIANYAHDTVIPARWLYGRPSSYLPSSLSYTKSAVTYNYLYTFDNEGYITEVDVLLNGEDYCTYSLQY